MCRDNESERSGSARRADIAAWTASLPDPHRDATRRSISSERCDPPPRERPDAGAPRDRRTSPKERTGTGIIHVALRRLLVAMVCILPTATAFAQSCTVSSTSGTLDCTATETRPVGVGSWTYGISQGSFRSDPPETCNSCDARGGVGFLYALCVGSGGNPDAGPCLGSCPGATPVSDANILPIAKRTGEEYYLAGCPGSVLATPWGSTFKTDCGTPPVERENGVERRSARLITVSGPVKNPQGQCTGFASGEIIGARERPVASECPAGYVSVPFTYTCTKKHQTTCAVNNPVHPALGGKVETEVDFAGAGSSPLALRRTYNSFGYFRPPSGPTPGPDERGGVFGFYWRTNFDRRLHFFTGAAAAVAAYRHDGSLIHFDSSGVELQPDPTRPGARLARLTASCSSDPAEACWRLTTGLNEIEDYNAAGRLLALSRIAADLDTLRLSYDGAMRLIEVRDDRGRRIQFQYAQDGVYATGAQFPDGTSISYGYDDLGRLSTVGVPDLDGQTRTRTYHYEDPRWWYALTGITQETGSRFSKVEYNADASVARTVRAPDAAGNGVLEYRYAYAPTATQVTDARGTSLTYLLGQSNGAIVLAGVSRPCASCGGSSAQSIQYDARGHLDQMVDFRGVGTDFDYDARGLQIRRVEASTGAGGTTPPERRTLETTWHATLALPLVERTIDAQGVVERLVSHRYNARGQEIARCEIDPAIDFDSSLPGVQPYECGSLPDAPAGARQTRTIYCDQVDTRVPDPVGTPGENLAKGCPLPGLVRRIDGPRVDVADHTTLEYRLFDDASCTASPTQCSFRKGDAWRTINALGHVTETLTYDGAGRPTRRRDANGVFVDSSYHPRGWLRSRTVRARADGSASPDDAVTTFEYDARGNPTRTTYPDGRFDARVYDAANRVVSVSDNTGAHVDYVLDAMGERVVEKTFGSVGATDLRRRMAREFDAQGRLAGRRDALTASGIQLPPSQLDDPAAGRLVATYGYDANDQLQLVLDGLNRESGMVRDALGRVVETRRDRSGTDPSTRDARVAVTYDARGNVRTVTDPNGLVTSYRFDAFGNTDRVDSPDAGVTQLAYDPARNLMTHTDARGVVRSGTFDALNRVTRLTYSGSVAPTTFEYDAVMADCLVGEAHARGRLVRTTAPGGEVRMCYDLRGNLVRRVQVSGTIALTTAFGYDRADRVTSITYPGGMTVVFKRDAVGRVQSISTKDGLSVVAKAGYEPWGPLNVMEFGDGSNLRKAHDANYRPDYVDSSSAVGIHIDVGTDVVGNVTSMADTIGGVPTRRYRYDALDRLTRVGDGNDAQLLAWTYDPSGDRQSSQAGVAAPESYAFAPGSHRLGSVGGRAREYDANGNTTAISTPIGPKVLRYDDRNRLSGSSSAGIDASYTRDAMGNRLGKQVAGITRRFVHDSQGHLLGEYGESGSVIAEYIWLDDAPVALRLGPAHGGALHFIQSDHQGIPRRIASGSGRRAVVRWDWSAFADPFGAEQPAAMDTCPPTGPCTTSPFEFNLRFPGQYFDSETGLNHNLHRDYDATTGRYVEADPVGLRGGISVYGYVGGNPLGHVDPEGLRAKCPHNDSHYLPEVQSWLEECPDGERMLLPSRDCYAWCDAQLEACYRLVDELISANDEACRRVIDLLPTLHRPCTQGASSDHINSLHSLCWRAAQQCLRECKGTCYRVNGSFPMMIDSTPVRIP